MDEADGAVRISRVVRGFRGCVKTASVAAVYDRRAFKIRSFGGHRPPLQLARRGFQTDSLAQASADPKGGAAFKLGQHHR